MTGKTYIYGLLCPVENKIKYVGKANDPVIRYRTHVRLNDSHYHTEANHRKQEWIRRLKTRGQTPMLVILDRVVNEHNVWRAAEHRWMEKLLKEGHPLVNDVEKTYLETKDREQVLQDALDLGREMFGSI